MTRYNSILGASTTFRGVSRAGDVVAALAPPPPSEGGTAAMTKSEPTAPSMSQAVVGVAPGAFGAVVGALSYRKHWVLGALGGHALAANAMPLWNGGVARKRALYNLAVEGSGIAGALYMKKHPVLGWIGGILAGSTVTSFFKDSPAYESRMAAMKMLGK